MRRHLATVFVALLSISPISYQPAHAWNAAGEPSAGSSAGPLAPASRQPTEIVALRTQTSRTYFDRGRYMAMIYPGPVNYRDAQDHWQPVDDALVPSAVSGYAYQNKANGYTVLLPSDLGKTPIRVETRTGRVDLGLVGGSGTGKVSGNNDTFPLSGATVSYSAGNDVLKENIVLSGPGSPSSFVYTLRTSAGLAAHQNLLGGVDLTDATGRRVLGLLPPSVRDGSGPARGRSSAVSLALGHNAAGQTVTLSVDRSWLSAPGRRFPVTIDPTVVFYYLTLNGANQDCTIYGGPYADTNECIGYADIDVGYDGFPARALLQFNVQNSLPPDVTVQNAELGMYNFASDNSTAIPISVYALTRSWSTSCTWNSYDGTNPWTTPGGDFSPTAWATNNSVSASPGWVHWYPTQLVQDWINGTVANDGMLLKEPNESQSNILYLYDSEYSDSTYWPYLKVIFDDSLGERPFYTMVGQQLTDTTDLAVNVANGNAVLHATDLSMPGVGLPLVVDRYYNSKKGGATDLGNGWRMGTGPDVILLQWADGSVSLQGAGAYQIPFIKNPDGSFSSPPGIDATLSPDKSTLTFHQSGEQYAFNNGVLVQDKDRSGNTISFAYTPSGAYPLSSITDTLGHITTFTSNANNQITQMTDSANRTYQYSYDGSNNLVSYADPAGKVTQYAYDSSGDLTQITDPNGNVTKIAYDSNNRATSITDAAGHVTSFTYNTGNTVVTDPNGHATTYYYDIFDRVTSVTDAENHTTHIAWTGDDQVVSTQAPSGATTTYTYDSNNNLTQVTLPTGAHESWRYAAPGQPYLPSSATDTQGNTTSFAYTPTGLPSQTTDPNGKSASFTYNSNGTVASETDENGHIISHTYTSLGLPLQDTPPSPKGTTSYAFNSYNLEASVTDGNGKLTTFSYDADGRLTGIGYANGSSIGYAYDADGSVLSMTDGTGTTSYTYDVTNQLTTERLPNGQAMTYTYDSVGNLVSKMDSGGTVSYGYGADEELTSATDRQNKTYTVGYDADGNRTSIRFPNGVTESMTYNSAGGLTEIKGATAASTLTDFKYSYTNPSTNQTTLLPYRVTDVGGNTSSYTYDNGNELTQAIKKNSVGSQIASYAYGYDSVGNLTSKTVNGTNTTYSYNAANELTSSSGGTSMTYTYDGNGDRTSSSNGTTISLNPAGQITSITPPGGSAIAMSYTGLGEQQRIGSGSTKYQYDATGLSKQSDSLGNSYFTSLPDGTLLAETVPSGTYAGTYYYLSDGNGSVAALTDSTGAARNSYGYDPLGSATSSGSVPNSFTYQGGIYDSSSHVYYTGSGYYDPATGQSFGCQDKGWVDPGEDLCGQDESLTTYCSNLLSHVGMLDRQCKNGAHFRSQIFGIGVQKHFWFRISVENLHILDLLGLYGPEAVVKVTELLLHHPEAITVAGLLTVALEGYLIAAGLACRKAEYVDFYYYTLNGFGKQIYLPNSSFKCVP